MHIGPIFVPTGCPWLSGECTVAGRKYQVNSGERTVSPLQYQPGRPYLTLYHHPQQIGAIGLSGKVQHMGL